MATWCLTLAWDGTHYCGWQRQPNALSIQEVVETRLAKHLGGALHRVTASGRTDSGVHTAGQLVSFSTDVDRSAYAIQRGLNTLLPRDIAVLKVEPRPSDFCARRWSRRKLYRYRILNRKIRCPFRDPYVWTLGVDLDLDAMAVAGQYLVGRHDYSSFRASGCTARHPVRCIESVTVSRHDEEVWLEFVGNGFLRYQVRIMVGTLAEVGRGRLGPGNLPEIIDARNRQRAGKTAAAKGLCLQWVEVGDGPPNGGKP